MKKPWHIPPEFNSFILIKFFSKPEWRNDFVNGNLYMNTVGYFHQIEKANKGQFDNYDGIERYIHTTSDMHWTLEKKDDGKFWYVNKPGLPSTKNFLVNGYVGRNLNAENKILCLYALWIDNKNKKFLKIDPRIINDFGEYAAVIIDTPEFIHQVYEKANFIKNKLKKPPILDFVEYIPEEKCPAMVEMGVYRKFFGPYSYQNEFRICLDIKNHIGKYTEFKVANENNCFSLLTSELINLECADFSNFIMGNV